MIENIKAGADIHAGDGGYGIGTQENYDAFVKIRNQSLAQARIRRLIEEAQLDVIQTKNMDGIVDGSYIVSHDKLEKFAKLMVSECIDLFNEIEYGNSPLGSGDPSRIIKQHLLLM